MSNSRPNVIPLPTSLCRATRPRWPTSEQLANLDRNNEMHRDHMERIAREIIHTQQVEFDWVEFHNRPHGKSGEEWMRERGIEPIPRPVPWGYDSWSELWLGEFGSKRLRGQQHASIELKYTVEHTYKPDWLEFGGRVLVEQKGSFREPLEAQKYRHIAYCHPDRVFLFVFMTRDQPLPWAKPRPSKGNTRRTHEEWARDCGFDYTYIEEYDEYMAKHGDRLIQRAIDQEAAAAKRRGPISAPARGKKVAQLKRLIIK